MIMVGRKNRFDFPHEETLYVLQKNQIRIHRTDQAGTIMIVYKEMKRLWVAMLPISNDF